MASVYSELDTQAPARLSQIIGQNLDPLARQQKFLTLKNLTQQGQMNDLKFQEAGRDEERRQKFEQYMQTPQFEAHKNNPDKTAGVQGIIQDLTPFMKPQDVIRSFQEQAEMQQKANKPANPSNLSRLMAEYKALPPDTSPEDRRAYMNAIRKESETAKQISPTVHVGGGGSPYYQFIGTPQGIAVGNARTGGLSYGSVGGAPVVKSADDPNLQGRITAAESEGKVLGEKRGNMGATENALSAVRNAKGLLDAGVYTGSWGPIVKGVSKWTPGMDKTKAANTEQFISEVGNTVIPRLKEFGGNDSNEEMRYLKMIQGGDITFEKEALKKILADVEKKIQRGIDRTNQGLTADGKSNTPGGAGAKFLGFE